VSLDLVLIQPGSFTMGDDGGESDEIPAHKVTITKPFYLGKYEVTQEQWEAVMGANPSYSKGPKKPVENVSWNDCQEFVKKLNERLAGTSAAVRLPTEAEWEYACRAGTTTKYSFGDNESDLGDYAWYDGNSNNKTHPVGEKKPNARGLYDMHGNVWEWCRDWYDDKGYERYQRGDLTPPSSGASRVLRGGSWVNDDPDDFRCACRLQSHPDFRYGDFFGFRVARTVREKL
jgi:formylglycine-generating enzyme required for sulfatase activity